MSTGNAAAAAGVALEQSPGAFTPGPVRTRTPSVGFAGGLLVLGLAAVAGAGAVALATAAGWSGNHIALGIAAGLGVLGLSLVVAGLAGRRGGWLQPFAWLGIWAAFFTSVIPAGLSQPWTVGEKAVAVTSLTGSTAYQMGIGDLKVDLTTADFRKSPQQPDRVTATVGLGQLNIVVPKGAKVTVHAKGRAGDLVATGSQPVVRPDDEHAHGGASHRVPRGTASTGTRRSPTAAAPAPMTSSSTRRSGSARSRSRRRRTDEH